MTIRKVPFDNLPDNEEGIVLIGTGGDMNDWVAGVTGMWVEEGIGSGPVEDMISDVMYMKTSGGRTDLLLVLAENTTLNIGKLAMWRIRFGDASWLSDYKVNYASQH